MATSINPLLDGTVGSASTTQANFDVLINQGQAAIDQCVTLRENTLLLFNNALEELNGKRVRANRLAQIGVPVKFLTSDLKDINQPITTATLRVDANNIVLRERQAPGEAIVSQVRFSASEGTIQALQVPQTGSTGNLGALYRVATQNGAIPVGTFDIQLLAPVTTGLIIFDMMDMPAGPDVVASISVNGITYTPAVNLTQNGYRWAAWFLPAEVQYIRIAITPALPDSLGGSVFTFGLTDFHAFSVQYHLQADVYTNQIQMTPRTANVQFMTDTVSGVTYFLSLGGNPAQEVFPGTIVPVPGAAAVTNTGVTLNGSGLLSVTLPADVYLPSVVIIDTTTPASPFEMRTAPGLSHLATPAHNQYVTIDGSGNMYLVVYGGPDAGRTFTVSYVHGPAELTAQLHVQLTTSDLNTTPVFAGAQLVEV
jgi:hypothetical protein